MTLMQHPLREEPRHAGVIQARGALDELDEPAVALAGDPAHVVVLGRGVHVHLQHQAARIVGEHVHVGVAHRLERRLAGLADGGLAHRLERLGHAARGARQEELLLRAEEAEDVRLRDAGPLGDVLGGRAVEPARGELVAGGLEDLLAPLSGGASGT